MEQELENRLVKRQRTGKNRKKEPADTESRLTIKNMPTLPYAVEEALSRLRINISFLGSEIKKIMIVSTMPDEGKSFVAIQTWRQMAQTGTRTVLVDADLRKSVMVDKYEMKPVGGGKILGTSYYLSHDVPMEKVVFRTNIEDGDIMPNVSNVVNPAPLLESSTFKNMLETLSDTYRFVFLDVPPLNLVADGEKIASLCDGAILVVRGSETPKSMIKNSLMQLKRAGCPLLGMVLNRVERSREGYYYKKYSGRGYYGKYGKYGKYSGYYGSGKN